MTYLMTRLAWKVFISSKQGAILFSCSNACFSNICSANMCFSLSSKKSEFPIKQAFLRGLRPGKNSRCGHTCPACHFVCSCYMAQKTEGTLSYASSVSLAAFIAWMVASTIFNSLSFREPSMASMRFLHSLPLFLDG